MNGSALKVEVVHRMRRDYPNSASNTFQVYVNVQAAPRTLELVLEFMIA